MGHNVFSSRIPIGSLNINIFQCRVYGAKSTRCERGYLFLRWPIRILFRKCMIDADLLYFYDIFVVGLVDIDSLEHHVDFILFLSGRL